MAHKDRLKETSDGSLQKKTDIKQILKLKEDILKRDKLTGEDRYKEDRLKKDRHKETDSKKTELQETGFKRQKEFSLTSIYRNLDKEKGFGPKLYTESSHLNATVQIFRKVSVTDVKTMTETGYNILPNKLTQGT